MKDRGTMICRYQALIQQYRRAGYDGTSARKKAWDQTFGREIKTVEDSQTEKMTSGIEAANLEENPDKPGEFRIG